MAWQRRWRTAILAAAVLVWAPGCALLAEQEPGLGALDRAAPPDSVAPESVPPGALLSAEPASDVAPELSAIGARVTRVIYSSRSGVDGRPIEVTGVVVEPGGAPPPGGWPVVSYAHGSTGLADSCAPSRSADMGAQLPIIAALVRAGYLVTATDYEGLGTPGPHPYLHPVSEARGVIDAVGAARALVPAVSSSWVALGASQGGQAAWATAEQALGDPGFLGAVALAPPTDLSPALDDVNGDPMRKVLYGAVLASLATEHPELRLPDLLSGAALDGLGRLEETCLPIELGLAPDGDFAPSAPAAADQVRRLLDERRLPAGPSAPLFVAAGTADDLVPVDSVDTAVAEACALGTVVEYGRYDGAAHPALPAAEADALRWMTDRFAGAPAPSTC